MVGVSVSAVRLYHFVLTTPGLERLAGRTKSIIGLQSHRSQNSHRILSVSSTLFFPSDGHRFSDRTHSNDSALLWNNFRYRRRITKETTHRFCARPTPAEVILEASHVRSC